MGCSQWLKQFDGIGDKYARNLMMDVYHPDFRDSISVDERVRKVSAALGFRFESYAAHEAFYLGVARAAGLNGWEVDRLLYRCKDEVIRRVAR
jgi:hypothetical protein